MAYALAQNIYIGLPLPGTVQPRTVMKYHMKGEPQDTRQE